MTTYRALDFEFVLQVDDPALRDYVETVFDALVVDERATEVLEVIRITATEDGSASRYDVRHGDAELGTGVTAPAAVDAIVQRANSRCVDSSGWLSTHASCVSRDGHAILFAAHSESGKSTLAAGLVRAGFAYVTDEAVAFDWDAGCIQPYPKPISLDPGSWPLFPELDPRATYTDDAPFSQWHVPAAHVGPGRVSAPCRARWLVFPKYEAGADTAIAPITRGEALVEWSKNTFRFNEHGRRALELLGGLVTDVDCYRMTVGDLDDAVARVEELVGA